MVFHMIIAYTEVNENICNRNIVIIDANGNSNKPFHVNFHCFKNLDYLMQGKLRIH